MWGVGSQIREFWAERRFLSRVSMQLYALDGSHTLLAPLANKEKIYICPECQGTLRMRSGPSKQPHFYHLQNSHHCRQSGKSEEHLRLQLSLYTRIEEGASMECPFPLIGRIADVAWGEKKIVFEIQCSPLSLQEAQERTSDYASLGYTVIWLLHDQRFNKRRLSSGEHFLRERGCYFANKDTFYDQFEIIHNNQRLFKGTPLPIDPLQLLPLPSFAEEKLPAQIETRLEHSHHSVRGDLLDRLSQNNKSLTPLLLMEERFLHPKPLPILPLSTLLSKAYTALLHFLLKRV